jgi:hypothetical protein
MGHVRREPPHVPLQSDRGHRGAIAPPASARSPPTAEAAPPPHRHPLSGHPPTPTPLTSSNIIGDEFPTKTLTLPRSMGAAAIPDANLPPGMVVVPPTSCTALAPPPVAHAVARTRIWCTSRGQTMRHTVGLGMGQAMGEGVTCCHRCDVEFSFPNRRRGEVRTGSPVKVHLGPRVSFGGLMTNN